MSRFSINLFCVAPDEEFICTICLDVLDDPLELPCRHMFCCQCLNSYGELTCPLCRICYKEESRKAPAVGFQNLLRKLKMKCENRMCSATVTLGEYLSHQSKCDFASFGCPFENCTQEVYRKDECQRVICPYGCGVTLPHREIDHHYHNNCSKGVRLCQTCDVMYNYEQRAGHNCVELLKEEIKSLKAEISSLKAENHEKDNRIRHLEQQLYTATGTTFPTHAVAGPSSGVTTQATPIQAVAGPYSGVTKQATLTQATAVSPGLSASAALTTSPGQDRTPTAVELLNTLTIDEEIIDLLLLADSMVLVATWYTLMLYDLSDTQLQTMSMNCERYRLCKDGDGTVFVLDRDNSQLKCLEVDKKDIKVKTTCRLSAGKEYCEITALDKTLAVSYGGSYDLAAPCGVDIIDSSGAVLQNFNTGSHICGMCSLPEGDLVCRDEHDYLLRWSPKEESVLFRTRVPEIPDPTGVASLPNRTLLVGGGDRSTLSLINERGNFIRHLYKAPSGLVCQLSVQGDTCVLSRGRRFVEVIKLVY